MTVSSQNSPPPEVPPQITPPNVANLRLVACRNGIRLSRLTNDLLDVDRLQSGKLELDLSQVDLRDLLHDSIRQNEPFAASYNVRLELVLCSEPAMAHLDVDRMLQVTTNLLSNAVKFSPSGSKIRVGLSRRGKAWRISISDEGPGVSPDIRERLFMRFAQGGGILNPSGTGLGLAISKGIVERHKGTIWLDSGTQIGATFHVDLPAVSQPDEDTVDYIISERVSNETATSSSTIVQ